MVGVGRIVWFVSRFICEVPIGIVLIDVRLVCEYRWEGFVRAA